MMAHPWIVSAVLACVAAMPGCGNRPEDERPKMGSSTNAVSSNRRSQIEASVGGWVARERGWRPDQYRIELKDPRDGGATEVVHVVFLEDERRMTKGGGESVELFLDAKTLAVTADYRFQ
jgi:hypothetical protein